MNPIITFDRGDLLVLNRAFQDLDEQVLFVGELIGRVNADGSYKTRAQTLQEVRETSGKCIEDADWKSSLVGPFAVIRRTRNKLTIYCPPGSGGLCYSTFDGGLSVSTRETNLYARTTLASLDIHSITRHLIAAPALQSLPFSTISKDVERIPGGVEAHFTANRRGFSNTRIETVWPPSVEPRTEDFAAAGNRFFGALSGFLRLLRSDGRHVSVLLSGGVDSAVLAFAARDAELDVELLHRVEKGHQHGDVEAARAISAATGYPITLLDDSEIAQDDRERRVIADAVKGFGQLGTVRSTYYRSMTRHEATGGFVLDGQNMDSLYAYRVIPLNMTFNSRLQNCQRVSTAVLLTQRMHEITNTERGHRTNNTFLRSLGLESVGYNNWLYNDVTRTTSAMKFPEPASNFVKLKQARFLGHGQNSIRMRKVRFGESLSTYRSVVASEGILPFLLMQFPVTLGDVLTPKRLFKNYVGSRLGESWTSFQRRHAGGGSTTPISDEAIFGIYDNIWDNSRREINYLQSISSAHNAYLKRLAEFLRTRTELNRFGIANACNLASVLRSFEPK